MEIAKKIINRIVSAYEKNPLSITLEEIMEFKPMINAYFIDACNRMINSLEHYYEGDYYEDTLYLVLKLEEIFIINQIFNFNNAEILLLKASLIEKLKNSIKHKKELKNVYFALGRYKTHKENWQLTKILQN